MSRVSWNLIKESKAFYISTYRRVGTLVIVMLIINMVFIVSLMYSRFHQPGPDFYSTNGITSPIQLTPLDAPNYSEEALLPSDPINDEGLKVIPE